MSERLPWTRAELQALIPDVENELRRMEDEEPSARPLGLMSRDESLDYLLKLLDLAATRPLTGAENFLGGQLLAVYEMAIRAEMLGKKGKYFVIAEDQISELLAQKKTPGNETGE